MKQYNVGLPMEKIANDFMGPLPRSNTHNGNALRDILWLLEIILPTGQKQFP